MGLSKGTNLIYGSQEWLDSDPDIRQRIAYAIECGDMGDPDDGYMGWGPQVEAIMALFKPVGWKYRNGHGSIFGAPGVDYSNMDTDNTEIVWALCLGAGQGES